MTNDFLMLGLAAALLGVACDSKEQCVADCNGQGSSGEPQDTSSDDGSDSGSGGDSLVCGEAREEATEFIEQNRDCQTVLDCVAVDGLCYDGDISNQCGTLGLSVNADMEAWQAIADDMSEACPCGGDACGPTLLCNDEQQCETDFGSGDFCPSIARDVDTFLAANRGCEVDEDCTQIGSNCYVDNGCFGVVVNVDTSREDWQQLDQMLESCALETSTEYCNYVGDCQFPSRCSDAGQCEIVF